MRLLSFLLAMILVNATSPIAKSQEKLGDTKLLEQLTVLEKASWEAAVRGDKEFFRTYLAPDSKWFLADGSEVGRDQVLKNLDEFKLTSYNMGKTSLLRISDDAAMILYRISYQGTHKNRTLISNRRRSMSSAMANGKRYSIKKLRTQASLTAPPKKPNRWLQRQSLW